MDQWYIPVTLLPAVALIAASTTNLMNSLSLELNDLLQKDCRKRRQLIIRKIKQLSRLVTALWLQFVTAGFLIAASLFSAILDRIIHGNILILGASLGEWLMIIAVLLFLISIVYLCSYARKAVHIKREQFSQRVEEHNQQEDPEPQPVANNQ